jgi:N-acetylglucosamine repressor
LCQYADLDNRKLRPSVNGLLEKATRQHTKDHNSRLVLRALYSYQSISRADLARLTRLTRTTVSDVVANLIARGLVEEVGQGPSSGGRTPTMLKVIDDSRHLIGVNLMSNELSGAILNLRGAIQRRARRPFQSRNIDSVLPLVYDLIDELSGAATSPLLGIGISTPGLMDTATGVVRRAVNFGWRDLPLRDLIQSHYKLPVHLGNGAHMAALTEHTFGGSQNCKNLIVIHVGQGIGAGIILNGQLFYGDAYGAGEIGHVVVAENGQRCMCGNAGCLETVADSRAIVRQAQLLAQKEPESLLPQLCAEPAGIDFDMVVRAFQSGDPAVRQLIREVGQYLGIAIANLVGVLNIERIVLTGPVAEFGAPLQETITHEIRRRSLPMVARSTEIALVRDNSDMILIGLSALLLHSELGLTHLVAR